MFFKSERCNVDVLLIHYPDHRDKLIKKPKSYQELVRVVKVKYGLRANEKPTFMVSNLEQYPGTQVELEEDAYEPMVDFLSEVVVEVVEDEDEERETTMVARQLAAMNVGHSSHASARSIVVDHRDEEDEEEEEDDMEESVATPPITPPPVRSVGKVGPSKGKSKAKQHTSPTDGETSQESWQDLSSTVEAIAARNSPAKKKFVPAVAGPSKSKIQAVGSPASRTPRQASTSLHHSVASPRQTKQQLAVAQELFPEAAPSPVVKKERIGVAAVGLVKVKSESDTSEQVLIVPERFKVSIAAPHIDDEAEFMTRQGHLLRKLLVGACKQFGLRAESAVLKHLVPVEDPDHEDGYYDEMFELNLDDTLAGAGVGPDARLIVEMIG